MYAPEQHDSQYDKDKLLSRGIAPHKFQGSSSDKWDYPVTAKELLYGYCYRSRCFGVPYKFARSITPQQQNKIKRAMDEIEAESCVR